MRQLASRLLEWHASGVPYAVASVVAVRGSAPLQPGAALCVHADGTVVGSVSGGCVEGAVYELAREARSSGQPQLASFGYSDDDAFAAGLTCGGEIDVFVQAVEGETARVLAAGHRAVEAERPAVVARVMTGADGQIGRTIVLLEDRHLGTTGQPGLDEAVLADARMMLGLDDTRVGVYGTGGSTEPRETRVLLESWSPSPRLLVFGANDHAAAVAEIGAFLGYRVTVCDARPTFTTPERFPSAHEVVVDWPHRYLAAAETDRRTVVCVMTHDPKFDVPLLVEALRRPFAYVGALGSRRTQAARVRDLREAGVSPAALARLRSPVGLDLGASTPQETAVSIAAELIAVRHGRSGRALSAIDGPIRSERHPSDAAPVR
ncbi:XdhC/CoxI family protein [Streptomyces sp. NPDC048275]|uniref:XdhC family protein n=1 Tax=Streptomyces sp. NPDC048275 TaxID=3155629 RepID=UPI00340CEC35